MEKQALRETLQQLHNELEGTTHIDDNLRELLHSVMQDIRDVLEAQEGQTTPQQQSLVDRLEAATTHFEVSHPRLTTAVGRLIDALSSMGI